MSIIVIILGAILLCYLFEQWKAGRFNYKITGFLFDGRPRVLRLADVVTASDMNINGCNAIRVQLKDGNTMDLVVNDTVMVELLNSGKLR